LHLSLLGIPFGKEIPFRTGVFHHRASPKSLIIYHFTLIIDGSFKGMEAVTPAKAGVQKCLFSWIPAFAGMTGKVIF